MVNVQPVNLNSDEDSTLEGYSSQEMGTTTSDLGR